MMGMSPTASGYNGLRRAFHHGKFTFVDAETIFDLVRLEDSEFVGQIRTQDVIATAEAQCPCTNASPGMKIDTIW